MLLWIAFALLTAAVLAWVLAPLAGPAPAGDADESAEAGTRAVYRDQLAEIEAERAQGLIGAAEAEAATIEVSRKLLASAARSDAAARPAAGSAPGGIRHTHIALITAAGVPLLTLGLYLAHGSPSMPSPPIAARQEAAGERADLTRMIALVEARLREAPDDGKGWEVIAPVYLKVGRFADAATAYANAARLQGDSVKLLAGIAESSIYARDGIVTDEARAAYEKILKLEPGRLEPRFWLAVAKEQDGRLAEALTEYKVLLDEALPGAGYRGSLETRIKETSQRMGASARKQPSGPSTADVEAASKLSPEQRSQMIAGMVDGLAQRLKSDGKDLPGWLRLLNAYAVLGRHEEARAALAEARRNFAGDQRALADLSRLATTLGLES
ncbi:MAG TPA: c-type cytochrome biogenesis protein CcmI [Hyphomicrobiaceae bacterium]|jgi:cytochrome c-type biogenesis protein CcmH|nr:c-type cytochrome biogenesis protein CcmI [Hyphomicrobiaceae bacterium]